MLTHKMNFVLLGICGAALLGGCKIKSVDSGPDPETQYQEGEVGGGGTGGTATTTSNGGAGGASTTASSTGTGGTTTTTTGPSCLGAGDPNGNTKATCDGSHVPIEAASDSCGPNVDEVAPGKGICALGYDIYTLGAAQALEDCLATIGVEPVNACDESKVAACTTAIYEDACDNAVASDTCDNIKTTCDVDPFSSENCKVDLRPLSTAGLESFIDCFNALPNDPCQSAYDSCMDELLTVQ
jgi:hypothetical protein